MIIGFSTTDKPLSRLIRWFTRSSASHSYVLFIVAGEPLVIHSTRHGINCDYYKRFVKKNKIVAEFKLLVDDAATKKALGSAIQLIDKPYDFLSILGFAWVLGLKAIGIKAKAPFRNRSAYHCSEFALMTLRKMKLDCADMKRELTSPEDLMECLRHNNQATEV